MILNYINSGNIIRFITPDSVKLNRVTTLLFALAVILLCTGSVQAQWLSQYAASYHNRGTITPTSTIQTSSGSYTTSNYKYPYWTLNATAGTTYFFDLCNSTGGSLSATRLIIHNGIYGTFNTTGSTITIQNIANGCSGSGTGLSKIVWTCEVSGVYYLESAASANATFWGVSANQTNVLRYYTLESQITTCASSFYDTGITGLNGNIYGYNNNESWVTTYYPSTPGNVIEASFTSFDTQAGVDLLYVYNGTSTTSPMFPGSPFSGTTNPGTFKATGCDGAITFRFVSNSSTIGNGWVASINCVPGITNPTAAFTFIPTGLTVDFTNTSLNGTSYTWDFGDGSLPVSSQNPTHIYANDGTYTVTLTVTNACGTSSVSQQVTVVGTGIADQATGIPVSIFPNPASGNMYVQLGPNVSGSVTLKLYNALGKLFFDRRIETYSDNQLIQIDVNDYANGFYILQVVAGDKIIHSNLAIQ